MIGLSGDPVVPGGVRLAPRGVRLGFGTDPDEPPSTPAAPVEPQFAVLIAWTCTRVRITGRSGGPGPFDDGRHRSADAGNPAEDLGVLE